MPQDSSQYKTAYGSYLGDYGSPRNPSFFGPDYQEMEARVRQRNRAAYGGISTDIREALGSAGLLASGALPEALAGAQISMGQQVAGDLAGLYTQEYGQKRGFDINRALQLIMGDFERGKQEDQQKFEMLQSFLSMIPGAASFIPGVINSLGPKTVYGDIPGTKVSVK